MIQIAVARLLQVLLVALLLAAGSTAFFATVQLLPYASYRDVLWPIVTADLLREFVVATACVGAWLALRAIARPRCGRWTTWVAALGLAPLALRIFRKVNEEFLPGLLEARSLVANAFLAPLLLGLCFVLSHLLARWQRGQAWGAGRLPLVPLGLVAVGSTLLAVAVRPAPAQGPNVIILLIDVLRADHLGCYGYERDTSPIIDAFARDAVLFENGVAASSFTKTSVASLFSGLPPHRHGVIYGNLKDTDDRVTSDVLVDEIDTLAERMYAAGLHTEAWVENGQLRAYMGFAQGFSRYHDQPGLANRIATLHREWLRGPTSSLQSFTYLHFIDVHGPYNPPDPYYGKFGPKRANMYGLGYDDWAGFKYRTRYRDEELSAENIDTLRDRYDECVASIDRWVGFILDDLREKGLYDDSLIVLTGDHGEGFWEHGFISHSTMPYEELVNVPLLIKLPGSKNRGKRVSQLVGHVDLAPTLLEFVGGDAGGFEGESFLSLLNEPATELPPREHYVEIHRTIGVRSDRWKYFLKPNGQAELYDLAADRSETNNVLAEHPDVAARFAAMVGQAQAIRDSSGTKERVTVDEETVEKLRALGYAGD